MSILVTKSSMPSFEEYCNEIRKLWDSHWLTNMGVEHKTLQSMLESYLDSPNVVLFANGHLALENAIAVMRFPQGSEVITTPFTFASTTHAIVRNGLIPIFCDIKAQDYTMDTDKIEALINEKTVAIVPVHVYGNICDVEKIDSIAKKHGLKVIYDAAHAFSESYHGVSAANFGDISTFSFHATKVFNTIEGGAVCTKNGDLVPALNDLKNFGIRGPECVAYIGGNAKMNEFQAAMGICNLRHIDDEIKKREIVVNRYIERLGGIPGIKLNMPREGVKSNFAYFPVVFDGFRYNRDEVMQKLLSHGVIARKYFYPLTNSFDCYRDKPFSGVEKTPIAEYIAERVVTLPLYSDLSMHEVDMICDAISD